MRAAWLLLLVGCNRVFGILEVRQDEPLDAVRDASFPSGLVAYFPLDTVASNRTPELVAGNDAQCGFDACPVPGPSNVGTGLMFDGVNDLLVVPMRPELETTSAFTVTAWMRQDGDLVTDDYGCAVSKTYGTNENNSWQMCVGGFIPDDLAFYSQGMVAGPSDVLTVPSFPRNEWHHVALVWDGTEKSIWVDGLVKASGPADIVFDGGPVLIGADSDFSQVVAQLPGGVDEVRIYNRALTGPEIFVAMSPL